MNKDFFSDGIIPEGKYFAISQDEFQNPNGKMTDIVISDGIVEIGNRAFCGQKTESIKLPDSVRKIGNSSFNRLPNLKSVQINSGVTELQANSFSYCVNLTEVIFSKPDTIKSVGDSCFLRCSLGIVVLPSTVEDIGSEAFRDNKITSLTLPDNIKTIAWLSFLNNSIENLVFPASLATMDNSSFDDNTLLKSIKFLGSTPPTFTGREYAFSNCEEITEILVPNSSVDSYKESFKGSTNLINLIKGY